MGGQNSKEKVKLKVGNLNYSGIASSPYEFLENQNEGSMYLNETFTQLANDFFNLKNETQYGFGSIDREWHERYSPLYKWDIGIKSNNLMMDQKEFILEWQIVYNRKQSIGLLNQLLINGLKKQDKLSNFLYRGYLPKKNKQKNLQLFQKIGEGVQLSQLDCGENQMECKIFYEHITNLKKKKDQIQEDIGEKLFTSIPPVAKQQSILTLILFQLMMFDCIAYEAILKAIYPQQTEKFREFYTSKHDNQFALRDREYRVQRKKRFTKKFLWEHLKTKEIIKIIQQQGIDILFLQEATKSLLTAIENESPHYRIVRPYKSNTQMQVILINLTPQLQSTLKVNSLRRQNLLFFKNRKPLGEKNTEPEYLCQQNILSMVTNRNTVVQALGNIILVCSHLSSNQQKNKKELERFEELCTNLKEWYPKAIIIAGGDLNGKAYESNKLNKHFDIYPHREQYLTTIKKRTDIQAQRQKAYSVMKAKKSNETQFPKDYLITNKQFTNTKMRTMASPENIYKDGSTQGNQGIKLLPNDQHPFDHYLQIVEIIIPKDEIYHLTDPKIKYEYTPEQLTDEDWKVLQQTQT